MRGEKGLTYGTVDGGRKDDVAEEASSLESFDDSGRIGAKER